MIPEAPCSGCAVPNTGVTKACSIERSRPSAPNQQPFWRQLDTPQLFVEGAEGRVHLVALVAL
jgi:hypothetical protein